MAFDLGRTLGCIVRSAGRIFRSAIASRLSFNLTAFTHAHCVWAATRNELLEGLIWSQTPMSRYCGVLIRLKGRLERFFA